jgi:SAM-dependent methyltransferase
MFNLIVQPESSDVDMNCRICGNSENNREHTVREMFFGTRETFRYLECGVCGTLQIHAVPDLRRYYRPKYYSFQLVRNDKTGKRSVRNYAARFIRRRAADWFCRSWKTTGHLSDIFFRLLLKPIGRVVVGYPDYLIQSSLDLGITRQSAILDVGAGAGATLEALRHFGFRRLTGVDPFLERDIVRENGIRLLKQSIDDLEGQFDLILANHSLEHTSEPVQTLKAMHRLLKPGHYAIIRMPVLSRAWRLFGVNWVQLDAPRHLFLFTVTTFSRLARDSGFEVKEISYDSTAFQFWGSQQYLRDIPLMDDRSHFTNPRGSSFTREEIASFEDEANRLNARAEGDQAVFYLCKK